ncbi:MAG TPA: alpha/beta hydrolase-fold protein [Polyangia bacterium]
MPATANRPFCWMLTFAFVASVTRSATAAPDASFGPDAASGPPVPVAAPRPERILSPEVGADRRVTFRLRAPKATRVTVERLSFVPKAAAPLVLSKDAAGVWSATVGPVDPGIYEYNFNVDGLQIVDPNNHWIQPQQDPRASVVEVPGEPALNTQWKDVPHGSLHIHHYKATALAGRPRRVHVYTPPGYETRAGGKLPVLYLLHGSGDNDATWSVHGRAHFLLDNLIADKKAKPMIVVMTDGHAVPRALPGTPPNTPRPDNTKAYTEELLKDVMPLIERLYRVRGDSAARAIVGLSMGGRQALQIGLSQPERFAWVAGMSSSIPPDDTISAALESPKNVNKRLKWLWVGCGQEDGAFVRNQEFAAKLDDRGITHVFRATPGGHNWPLWRTYLEEIVPQLFAR